MFFRKAPTWSPVELEYLKTNLATIGKDQLCIALSKSRNALLKKIAELNGTPLPNKSIRFQSKIGKREDLDTYCRSSWEANMMRLFKSDLISLIKPEYEPFTFSFTEWVKPKGGALSYTPDFKVYESSDVTKDKWIEVKGNWLRGTDKTKLKRFKKFYPEEFKKLIAVVSTKKCKTADFFRELGVSEKNILEYNSFKKLYSKQIKNWE